MAALNLDKNRGARLPGLAVVGAALLLIGFAPAAYAAPSPPGGDDDAGFLANLRQDGISYASPDQAVTAGIAVCTCLGKGESGLGLIHDLQVRNPGFDLDSASQFAAVAAEHYCPQQLSKS